MSIYAHQRKYDQMESKIKTHLTFSILQVGIQSEEAETKECLYTHRRMYKKGMHEVLGASGRQAKEKKKTHTQRSEREKIGRESELTNCVKEAEDLNGCEDSA